MFFLPVLFLLAADYLGRLESKPVDRTPPLIPRSKLYGNPDRYGLNLSPDGKYIAYAAPYKNVMNLWVVSSRKLVNARKNRKKSKSKRVTFDKDAGIYCTTLATIIP